MENWCRNAYWISPENKRFNIREKSDSWLHEDWAEFYCARKLMKIPNDKSATNFLLQKGWIRQTECSFEVWKLDKKSAWNIFDWATKSNCGNVFVEESIHLMSNIMNKIGFIDLPLKDFIEQYGE